MTIARGKKRSLAKKVFLLYMYMDQTNQIRAIMEAIGALKDEPVIRGLLDEAFNDATQPNNQARKHYLKRFNSDGLLGSCCPVFCALEEPCGDSFGKITAEFRNLLRHRY